MMQYGSWYAMPNPTKLITYGQDERGDLIFAVRVGNLGARPESAEKVAKRLCAMFEDAIRANWDYPLATVHLEEPDR